MSSEDRVRIVRVPGAQARRGRCREHRHRQSMSSKSLARYFGGACTSSSEPLHVFARSTDCAHPCGVRLRGVQEFKTERGIPKLQPKHECPHVGSRVTVQVNVCACDTQPICIHVHARVLMCVHVCISESMRTHLRASAHASTSTSAARPLRRARVIRV
jgi:hypothetical protein